LARGAAWACLAAAFAPLRPTPLRCLGFAAAFAPLRPTPLRSTEATSRRAAGRRLACHGPRALLLEG
jgi:hypothetical protein